MKNSETVNKNILSEKMSDVFLTIVDLLCNKYLFLTLLINIAIVSKHVVTIISLTTGMYMYYTAETSVIGSRPCRFFGLFCGLYPDKYLFMTVFKLMYFASLLLISLAVYLLIRRLSDAGKKMLAMLCILLPAAMFFRSSDREVLLLSLMFAFACTIFALYYLVSGKGKLKYLAPVFAALAVLIDVRMVYLCVIIPVVMFIKKYKTEKNVRAVSVLMIILSLTVFTVSAISSNDNKNSVEVKKYFEEHYSENYDRPNNYTDEESGTFHMSNGNAALLPDGFFKVTAIDLVTEWIPNIADTLLCFTFEDIFQGLCYIYIPLIVIYNQLTISEEKKRALSQEV